MNNPFGVYEDREPLANPFDVYDNVERPTNPFDVYDNMERPTNPFERSRIMTSVRYCRECDQEFVSAGSQFCTVQCRETFEQQTGLTVEEFDCYEAEDLAVTNSAYWPGVKIGATLMDAHFTNISMRALAEDIGLRFEIVRQVAVYQLKRHHRSELNYEWAFPS